jgi:hypothetical protein
VPTERKQSGRRITRVVFNPASVKTGNEQIVLRKPAAKPLLDATETKKRVDVSDRNPHTFEQHWATECPSTAILALLPPGVYLPSINLVHILLVPVGERSRAPLGASLMR